MAKLPSLPIETFVSVSELESGRALVRPIADLGLASYGEEEDAVLELSLFLAEHLRRRGARAQAAFSFAREVSVRSVLVEVPRADVRRGLAAPLKVSMPCAVLPDARASWVIVLPLGLTVFVERSEDFDEVVANEAKRQIDASELDSYAVLALFPPREHRLERTTVVLERDRAPEGSPGGLRRRMDEALRARHAFAVLRSVARRIDPADVKGAEPVGLDVQRATLDALLSSNDRASVLLVGEERVGKSALVQAWVRARRDDPPLLFLTSGAQLIAGMSGLGQWQERVRRVMEAVETLDAVLWLDDLRDLFGDRAGGFVDLPSAMKTWLDERRVRLIGEVTPEGGDLFATRQPALFSLMHPLRVDAQDARAARHALTARTEYAARHERHRPSVSTSAIETIVELTDRFLPYRPFPGKAVRLYEELRASAERAHFAEDRMLGASEVYEHFSRDTGIPLFLLRDDVAWRTDQARAFFERRLVGQREAIARIVDTLAVVKAGLAPGNRPLASFLFVGPTGVGKTALARALAELLFGSPARLVRFDMSELSDPGAAERLIRGTESDDGLLTARVRQEPFCVVLLDEIEKAHPSVFDLLLSVLGEGRLTDARGRTAYFHDAIVVMTSNLGTRHRARRVGIDPREENERERYVAAVEAHFRPELVNRIDRIVAFHALDRAQNRAVAERVVERIAQRSGLMELGASLEVSEGALDHLAEGGYAEAYGARALRRHLEDELVAPLARILGSLGEEARNARVVCRDQSEALPEGARLASLERGALRMYVLRGAERTARQDVSGLEAIGDRRRWAYAQLELPTVEELRERAAYLLAELSYGKPERVPGAVRQVMMNEEHRLREVLTALDAATSELDTIEELALSSVLAGEGLGDLSDDARAADIAFRSALLELLVSADPHHAITLCVQEWDPHRPLDRWLGGLLRQRASFGWNVLVHVYRDPVPAPDWPHERAYGPPRQPEEILERLSRSERDPLTALVRVRGRHAGALLALEAGVHRHMNPSAGVEQSMFLVRTLALRAELEDDDFTKSAIHPGPATLPFERRLLPAVREVHVDYVSVDQKRARVDVRAHDYWKELRAIALTHLLLLEERYGDRAALLVSPLDGTREDDEQ